MAQFTGFPEGKIHQVSIPDPFFRELLHGIDDLNELKLSIYFFWRMDRMEGVFRYISRSEIIKDELFMKGLYSAAPDPGAALDQALSRAVQRGTILHAKAAQEGITEDIYFFNSPKGRAALRAIKSGDWKPFDSAPELPLDVSEPPNIYRIYEENIGPLTPIIADELTEAEGNYPLPWIEEAIGLAVKNNKRSWHYTLAILERWRREGKHGKKEKPEDRSDIEEARRRYVEGEFSDFVEH